MSAGQRSRYVQGVYTGQIRSSIGADFMTKEVVTDTQTVAMQIWDTAGQERSDSIQVSFYRGAEACALVFDISNHESFEALGGWKAQFALAANVRDNPQFPYILIGNKSDLASSRKVDWSVILR